jgi:hypothetical protein
VRRAFLVLLGLVSACGGSATEGGGPTDGSNDGGSSEADVVVADEEAAASDGDAPDADAADPCADAGVPPATLACTGLYADFAAKRVAADAMEYTPATPLWSDGAQKQRWILLPPHTQIDISNPSEWKFPVGTKLFKEFRVEGHRVETRLFQKVDAGFWNYATYAWNGDESSATIHFGGPVAVGDAGATWNIPTNDDCNECHRGRQDRILGFEQVSLGLAGAQGLTLARLVEMGLVTPTPASVSLSIGDDGTGLAPLALGWFHVNCGTTCHNTNPSAAGFGAGMDLRLDPADLDGSPPQATGWKILQTTVGVPCVSGSLIGQTRIVPGDPARSVIYELINERGALQMPPIASRIVDTSDVAIVASWIRSLAHDAGPGPADAGAVDSSVPVQDAEAGVPEASSEDADSGAPAPDAETPDAAPDAETPDAETPDAAPDAAPDAEAPDAGEPDDAASDAGGVDEAAVESGEPDDAGGESPPAHRDPVQGHAP